MWDSRQEVKPVVDTLRHVRGGNGFDMLEPLRGSPSRPRSAGASALLPYNGGESVPMGTVSSQEQMRLERWHGRNIAHEMKPVH